MVSVNIAVLKAKLSFYLAQVKQGNEILVMDRNTPVARLLPSAQRGRGLVISKARKSPASLKAMKFHPLKHRTDSTALLREDRDRR
ncbi:MAG: type II toxin-antitoxin system prevent-host-death family antitoxin [Elusimicrobia bacterium]|nr:type II toxin-antitoxin system prevent-host-death family antitoxin [Elusimicrobiota bacterium]